MIRNSNGLCLLLFMLLFTIDAMQINIFTCSFCHTSTLYYFNFPSTLKMYHNKLICNAYYFIVFQLYSKKFNKYCLCV